MNIGAPQARTATDVILTLGIRFLASILFIVLVGFSLYYVVDRASLVGPSPVDNTMRELEELVKQEPDNANLRVQVAQAYTERDIYEAALAQYKSALEIEPDHQAALIGMGNIYLAQNNDKEALAAFQKVADLNKDNPYKKTLRQLEAVYYRLALIQERIGNLEVARSNLLQALDIERTDSDAWYLLGEVQRKQNRGQEAVESYRKAVSLDPRFTDAYRAMSAVYTQMGDPAMAEYADGMVAVANRDYQRGLTLLQRSTSAAPDNADALWGLGMCYENEGRYQEALDAYLSAVNLGQNHILAEMSLKRVYEKIPAGEVQK